jgi:hypothetical protein
MPTDVYAGPERRTHADRRRNSRGPDRRKPGRPRLADGEPSNVLNVRLPSGLHDQACRIALTEGISVSAVIRDALARFVRTLPDVS